ncbi:MAG: hypothetical protein J6A94_08880 [Lachnospiraceae bacterium]|nr:hypothetical protein [Lachnospiraceae bacterium]
MAEKQKETKQIMSHESIYKIMQWLPLAVSGLFFVKNVAAGNTTAMLAIGVCLVAFLSSSVIVKVRNVNLYTREFIMAIALPILVFMISLFSGASYSDDFSLFLAVIGMTGLYLEPQFTKVQIILIDILLVIMYVVHPEKAEELSQYILCVVVFTLAACLIYLVIKRGRAFIEMSEVRAKESETLLESIRAMGRELQEDFSDSSAKIEVSTQGLQTGSVSISKGASEVSDSCNLVQGKIKETGEQIDALNEEVKAFEMALAENKSNMEAMNQQMGTVSEMIYESDSVFSAMEEKMKEISGIAKEINEISFKLTILSLNASVEAAHAGNNGSGFEVLASEMRELSENSTNFSNQVSEVVGELSKRVEKTSERVGGSVEALSQSEKTLSDLVDSFERLNQQFGLLYDNIEQQNQNVNQIDMIFDNLNDRVTDMYSNSLANEQAVDAIVDAMAAYKVNVGRIVENTQSI